MPLANWATRAYQFWILDFGFAALNKDPIQNPKSKIQNQFGGLKGIQTLTRSLQDFYAVKLHHQPENLMPTVRFELTLPSF